MSQSHQDTMPSDSDSDYENEINVHEDEEDWQDAEEQQTTATPREKKEGDQKVKIDEVELRKKIRDIQQDRNLSPKDKAKQIQYLMSHGTTIPQSNASTSAETKENGFSKTFNNEKEGILGCKHYQRKCKLQANCCGKIVSCRFCHDDVEDHAIVRHETKNMLCMECLKLQPAAQTCSECGTQVARYYCDKCKLWDNDPKKNIYHCDDCGICRQGKGLGEDFFHCKKCNICLSISMKNHRCIERNLESDCPICGEYMFTSITTVIFMPCGHSIHKNCYTEYIQTSYQCPTCLKSLGDMSEYFNRLDKDLERQPMPSEYEKYISHIFCNDCEKKSPAKYHFFYHKCSHCSSYNTTVLRTENTEDTLQNNDDKGPSTSTSGESSTTEALGLSSNSDQERVMQPQAGSAAGNTNIAFSNNPRNQPPPSSSSSSRARSGAESNEG